MAEIPPFTERGVLPPGAPYEVTIDELKESGLVLGFDEPRHSKTWEASKRLALVNNLEILALQLTQVGVREIVIGGSFVEQKDCPNDINGYFPCDLTRISGGDLVRDLNLLDPNACWTWSPDRTRAGAGFHKRLPMWHIYRVELWPDYGQMSSVTNEHLQRLSYRSAFERRRDDNEPKGLVRLLL